MSLKLPPPTCKSKNPKAGHTCDALVCLPRDLSQDDLRYDGPASSHKGGHTSPTHPPTLLGTSVPDSRAAATASSHCSAAGVYGRRGIVTWSATITPGTLTDLSQAAHCSKPRSPSFPRFPYPLPLPLQHHPPVKKSGSVKTGGSKCMMRRPGVSKSTGRKRSAIWRSNARRSYSDPSPAGRPPAARCSGGMARMPPSSAIACPAAAALRRARRAKCDSAAGGGSSPSGSHATPVGASFAPVAAAAAATSSVAVMGARRQKRRGAAQEEVER